MTAPIQEPNNERALQGLGWQRDQLLRRPAPAGAETVPLEYAIVSGPFSNVTVPTATWTSIHTNGFSSGLRIGNADYLTIDDIGTDQFVVQIRQAAYYAFSISVDWSTDFQSQKAAQIQNVTLQPTGSTDAIFALPFLGTHAHFGCPSEVTGISGDTTVGLRVWQNSGSDKIVSGSTGIGVAFLWDMVGTEVFYP